MPIQNTGIVKSIEEKTKMEVKSEGTCNATQMLSFEEFPGEAMSPQVTHQWMENWDKLIWKNPNLIEFMAWDDPSSFLLSFEKVAEACQWPRENWVSQLLPALRGEAEKAFSKLEKGDKEDYEKIKAAILQREAVKKEVQRQLFRQFRYPPMESPQKVYDHLQELCHQWLKPERHTKEQILDLVVLEQFLAILPQEIQLGIEEGGPKPSSQVMALVEDILGSHQEVKLWNWQTPFQEKTQSCVGVEEVCSRSVQREFSKKAQQKVSKIDLPEFLPPKRCSDKYGTAEGVPTEVDTVQGVTDLNAQALSLLDVEEKSSLRLTHRPLYWEVVDENNRVLEYSGRIVLSKPEADASPEQDEITFNHISEDGEAFSGGKTLNKSEHENSQQERPKQRSQAKTFPGECQSHESSNKETCDSRPGSAPHQRENQRKPDPDGRSEKPPGGTVASQGRKNCRSSEGRPTISCFSDDANPRHIHSRGKNYSCFECKKVFTGESALHGHLRIHRPKRGPKPREQCLTRTSPPEDYRELNKIPEGAHPRKEPGEITGRTPLEIAHSKINAVYEPEQKKIITEEPIKLSECKAGRREATTHCWVKKLLYSQPPPHSAHGNPCLEGSSE